MISSIGLSGWRPGCSVVENDFIPQPTMKDLLDELEHSLYSRSGESSSARRTNLPVGVSSPSSTLMDPWARDFCISCAPDELDAPLPLAFVTFFGSGKGFAFRKFHI